MKNYENANYENTFDLEKEKFVLGAMLLKEGKVVPDVAAILNADDFYRPEHRLIYSAILKVFKEKKSADLLNLMEELRVTKDKQGNSVLKLIGIEYVLTIPEHAHTTAFAENYAKDIKAKSDQRKLIAQAEKIIHDAQQGLKSPLDIIADTYDAFNTFNDTPKETFCEVGIYLIRDFLREIENDQKYFDRRTGFSNIDKFQDFNPGLYVLGATPACGKTTFCWQMLEQIAESGTPAIFCSYEMETKKLAAKTFARKLFQANSDTALTAAQIRRGGYSNSMLDIAAEFFESKYPFQVRKFNDEDVNKLLAILRPIVQNSDSAPVVCIDYLQRLIPRDHKSADTRALLDDALFKLKDFSNETNTTFIAVSTFNRTNYNVPVSFENFKESGGIEYTADVVWAMQLAVTNNLSGEKVGDTRLKIEQAKQAQPREINVKCLKNRDGNNYDCYFKYFSAHDYFVPCDESDFILNIDDIYQKIANQKSIVDDDEAENEK